MITGIGYGKTILFGEHFVVHNIPAIASALDLKTTATLKVNSSLNDIKFIDESRSSFERRELFFSQENDDKLCKLTKLLLEQMNKSVNDLSCEIHLKSNVPEYGGAGLSAALTVSLVRLYSNYFDLNLSDSEVARISYKGEKLFHGTPSGIDNTVATYGGLLWFVKNNPDNIIEPLDIDTKGLLVIGDTRISHNVMELVAEVRRRKETEPEIYNPVFSRAKEIVHQARDLLRNGNWNKIGKLMNDNHVLLQKVGVSIQALDDLVDLSMKNGALGAKLTGGGGGGCMIALVPNEKIQENILSTMIDSGFHAYKTSIGKSERIIK